MILLFGRYQTLAAIGTNINQSIGRSVAWLTLIMVVLMAGIVIVRGLLNANSVAAQELVTYLHATVIMLASAYTLAEQGHVRVDIFYRRCSRKYQAWVDLVGNIVFLLPFALVTVFVSWDFVTSAWDIQETSADAGGLPAVFLLKSLLVVNGALLALQAIADSFAQLATLGQLELEAAAHTPEAQQHD